MLFLPLTLTFASLQNFHNSHQMQSMHLSLSEVAVCCLASSCLTFLYVTKPWESDKDTSRDVAGPLASPVAPKERRTLEQEMKENDGTLTVHPIGTVRSIYRLCVGTPRQGWLAPDARGRIELMDNHDVVSGLQGYSHVWISFVFHLNLVGRKTPTKITPPALGKKVGVLATRSPHRPNPVGLSLVRLERIETKKIPRENQRPLLQTVLHISGVDLVDGTPVLDIKPFIGTYDGHMIDYKAPSWVVEGLQQSRTVELTDQAHKDLEQMCRNRQLEFYSNADEAVRCVQQVLSMDVRSSYKTTKARNSDDRATNSVRLVASEEVEDGATTQQIDNMLLHLDTQAGTSHRVESMKSGAEDHVVVTEIEWMGDLYR